MGGGGGGGCRVSEQSEAELSERSDRAELNPLLLLGRLLPLPEDRTQTVNYE